MDQAKEQPKSLAERLKHLSRADQTIEALQALRDILAPHDIDIMEINDLCATGESVTMRIKILMPPRGLTFCADGFLRKKSEVTALKQSEQATPSPAE